MCIRDSLDIRQESTLHTEAVNEILDCLDLESNYNQLDEAQRMTLLARLIDQDDLPALKHGELSESSLNIVQVFDVVLRLRREISPRLFNQYVISMTHTGSHVMEVIFLSRLSGLLGKDSNCLLYTSPSPRDEQ